MSEPANLLDLIALHNAERASRGLSALTAVKELNDAAQAHAQWMAQADTMSHTGQGGSDPFARALSAGYSGFVAENIAAGRAPPEADVFARWMQSPSHKANIISAEFLHVGAGYAFRPDGKYRHFWVVTFGATTGTVQPQDPDPPDPDPPEEDPQEQTPEESVQEAVEDVARAAAARDQARAKYETLAARVLALELRKRALESIPDDPQITAWCADYTGDLTDTVATIEIPGEGNDRIIIRPGYADNAAHTPARDGQLFHRHGLVSHQAFYNAAILPGWQKWQPTYRVGKITAIDESENTADVLLDSEVSSAYQLGINQSETLSNVPVEYMECNAEAFAVDDRVVIEFTDRDWQTPKLIGFESHPKTCARILLAASRFQMPNTWLREAKYFSPTFDEELVEDATDVLAPGRTTGSPWPDARIDSQGSIVYSGYTAGHSSFENVQHYLYQNGNEIVTLGPFGYEDWHGYDWSVDGENIWFLAKWTADGGLPVVRHTRMRRYSLEGDFVSSVTISDVAPISGAIEDGGRNNGFKVRNGIAAYGLEYSPASRTASSGVDATHETLDAIVGETTSRIEAFVVSTGAPGLNDKTAYDHFSGESQESRIYTVYMSGLEPDPGDPVRVEFGQFVGGIADGARVLVSDDPVYGALMLFKRDIDTFTVNVVISGDSGGVIVKSNHGIGYAIAAQTNNVILQNIHSAAVPEYRVWYDTNTETYQRLLWAPPEVALVGFGAFRVEMDRSGQSMMIVSSSVPNYAWAYAETPSNTFGEHPLMVRVIDIATGTVELTINIVGPPPAELEIAEALLTSSHIYLRYLVQIGDNLSATMRIYSRATGDLVAQNPYLLGGESMLIDVRG